MNRFMELKINLPYRFGLEYNSGIMKDLGIFIGELRLVYQMGDSRLDVAEGYVLTTERELKRDVSDLEARVILAESGQFPEINQELRQRAVRWGSDFLARGELLNKPRLVRSGELLMNQVILGRYRTRDGD